MNSSIFSISILLLPMFICENNIEFFVRQYHYRDLFQKLLICGWTFMKLLYIIYQHEMVSHAQLWSVSRRPRFKKLDLFPVGDFGDRVCLSLKRLPINNLNWPVTSICNQFLVVLIINDSHVT